MHEGSYKSIDHRHHFQYSAMAFLVSLNGTRAFYTHKMKRKPTEMKRNGNSNSNRNNKNIFIRSSFFYKMKKTEHNRLNLVHIVNVLHTHSHLFDFRIIHIYFIIFCRYIFMSKKASSFLFFCFFLVAFDAKLSRLFFSTSFNLTQKCFPKKREKEKFYIKRRATIFFTFCLFRLL